MSIRVDSSPLIAGAVVVGDPGLGVLAEAVPSTGEHGAGYIYDSLEFPADSGKEVRGLITTWPTLGTLTAFEDSSFEYDGASDTFAFQMYVDGVAVGTPQTVSVNTGQVSLSAAPISGVSEVSTATLSTAHALAAESAQSSSAADHVTLNTGVTGVTVVSSNAQTLSSLDAAPLAAQQVVDPAAPTSASELAHVGVSGGLTATPSAAESTTELSAVALGFSTPMTVSDSTATSELVSVGLTDAVSLLVEQLASDAVLDPAPLAETLELRVGDLTVDTLASTLKLFFPRMGADLLAKSVFVQINDIYTPLSKNDRSSATARY
jgi:hypothetical protein